MSNLLDQLYQYLSLEKISIDKKEFEFQVQSHPNHNSLLAYVDTLSFFKIENFPLQVTIEQLDLLPNRFIAQLKTDSGETYHLLEREENTYNSFTKGKWEKIDFEILKMSWNNLVLIIPNESQETKKKLAYSPIWILMFFIVISILHFCSLDWEILFLALPMIGILFSMHALKDIFKFNNKVIDKLCNISVKTSCETVLKSKQWKLYEKVNLGEVSLLFFVTQIMYYFFVDIQHYFATQQILLSFSIPIILISLMYQAFVVRKWCSICLIIMSILSIEILIAFGLFPIELLIFSPVSLVMTVGLTSFSWLVLKPYIIKFEELKRKNLQLNRFYKNSELFNQTLISGKQYNLDMPKISLGNPNAQNKLTLIINPFCGHCIKIFDNFFEIFKTKKEVLALELVIAIDINIEKNKVLAQILYSILPNSNPTFFLEAIKDWYQLTDVEKFITKYKKFDKSIDLDFLTEIKEKLNHEELNFTPGILLNQYIYPENYRREDLHYFIEDFAEFEY